MSKWPKLKLKTLVKLGAYLGAMAIFGQNCTGGFEPLRYTSLSSLSTSLAAGTSLYTKNCAGCHGPISNSAKLGRSATQIKSALSTVIQMRSIRLSSSDIASISAALNDTSKPLTQVYQCTAPSVRGISADRLRKMTLHQLKNTLRDLLGTTISADTDFQQKLASIPDDSLKVSVGEVNDNPSLYHARALYDVSLRAVAMMDSDSQLRSSVLGTCTVSALDETCVRSVISQFGLRVFRRPPTDTETADLVNFYNSMGAGTEGLDYLFERMMQNPTMVFHIEDGTAPSNGRYRLSDYEIASRISYMTSDTMPDAELFAAASRGELQNLDNVRTHVARLLLKQDGSAKVQDFVRYYTRLKDIVPNPKTAASIGINPSGLTSEMKQELQDFVNYIVFATPGTFSDLMTSTAAFPKSNNMVTILQSTPATPAQPTATSPSHPGLLHRPALLVSAGDRTSPILRGALIRKAILCDSLGDPPADAVAARTGEIGDLTTYSNRDATDRLTSPSLCLSCHSSLNPLGYTYEKFNQLGALRAVEPIFDAQGNMIRTFPIDTTVADPKIENGGPTALTDSTELVAALAHSRKAKACYSQKMFEYYTLRSVDPTNDGCALSETETKTGTQDLRSVLIDSIANEDIFWRKQP